MMKMVYSVLDEIKSRPDKVEAAQKLSLDKKRPQGLNGTYGLYGSVDWLNNLKEGIIPQKRAKGVVQRTYKVGMYDSDEVNTIELMTEGGCVIQSGIFVNDVKDAALFEIDKRVEILYFIEDLKAKDAVTGRYKTYDFVYEMRVEV